MLGAHELVLCKVVIIAVVRAGMSLEQHILSQPAAVHSHKQI